MNEAMIRIRYELGKDAIIVSKRWVKQKGIRNFFKNKVLEVTAAADNNKPKNPPKAQIPKEKEPIKEPDNSHIEKDLKELKEIVYELMENKNKELDSTIVVNKDKEYWIEILRDMELDKKVIQNFFQYCEDKNFSIEDLNNDFFNGYIQEYINNKINLESDIKEKIWVFIGPTGVGKTTTIAKIAADEALNNGKEVGLITLDTYRIGAVEQLKTYADILGIPLEIVVNKEDLPRAISSLSHCDLILVDSTGRSSFNEQELIDTKDYIDQIEKKINILVISMTTKNNDIKRILHNYKKVGYDYLVLSKMDETQSYGNILNLSNYSDKPISYIATGQSVPDDIEKATKEWLCKHICKEVGV